MRTLFEVPVYLAGEEEYEKKCDRKIQKEMDVYRNRLETETGDIPDEESIRRHETRCAGRTMKWKFNKIIGYISIAYDEEERRVVFEVYIEDEPVRFDSARKKEMLPWTMLGDSFTVDDDMDSDEIRRSIEAVLDSYKRRELSKRFIDDESCRNMMAHADLRGAMGI